MTNTNQPSLAMIGNFISHHGHTPQVSEILLDFFTNAKIKVCVSSRQKKQGLRLVDMLKFAFGLQKKQIHLVLIDTFSGNAFLWCLWVSTILRLKKIPYIPVLHGGNLPVFSQKLMVHTFVVSYLKHAVAIISPSPYLANWSTSLGASATIIHNPISEIFYSGEHNHNQQTTTTYLNTIRVLWVRRFHSIYRPQIAIHVLNKLLSTHPESTLTMIGPDSGELDICRQLATKLKIQDKVCFEGKKNASDIVNISNRHTIFLNTSAIDNTPSTLLEAAAMHIPIVSTSVGGIPVLLTHQKHALLAEESPDLVEHLATAILDCVTDTTATTQRIETAYKLASERRWIHIWPKWKSLFESHGICIPG